MAGNPMDNLTPEQREEVRKALGDKFERDVKVATGVANRVTRVLVKLYLQPKIDTAKKIINAILDEK